MLPVPTLASNGWFFSLVSHFLSFGDSNLNVLADSKVTEKFQVTIPRTVREALRLDIGDRLMFLEDRGQIVVKKGRLEVQI